MMVKVVETHQLGDVVSIRPSHLQLRDYTRHGPCTAGPITSSILSQSIEPSRILESTPAMLAQRQLIRQVVSDCVFTLHTMIHANAMALATWTRSHPWRRLIHAPIVDHLPTQYC